MRSPLLLRPGWLALIAVTVVFSALCFWVLAPWQFSRDSQTEARNAAIAHSLQTPPRPLNEVVPPGTAPDAGTEWTHVSLRGRYLPQAETLGWLRTVQGEAAIEVLTPFELAGGQPGESQVVLVNRGYVRPVDDMRPPPFPAPPPGEVALTARVRLDEADAKQRPVFERDGFRWTYAVDSHAIAPVLGRPLQPGYLALSADAPGVLAPLPLPQLETGPYFSYALQWIAFGVMAPLGVAYFLVSEIRRRREAGAQASTALSDSAAPHRQRRRSVATAIAEEERAEEQAERAARQTTPHGD